MRSLTLLSIALFIINAGCGGVVKENRDEKGEEQPVPTENEYGFGARLSESPFIIPSEINIRLAKDDTVKIDIFTSDGDSTGISKKRFLKSGDNIVQLNLDSLSSGVYHIKIANSDTTITIGMSILR